VRRALALGALLSLVPTGLALLVVRPAQAAGPAYDQVGLTAVVAGVRTDGVVGASGGLVTLDSGSAYVTARLDASPSAQVLAAPVEPGTLARTGAGQVNGPAGTTVIDVPDAEARYPGAQTRADYASSGGVAVGPLTAGTTQAHAQVGPDTAVGTARAASYALAGVLSVGPSTSTVTMRSAVGAATVSQVARTAVSSLDVVGVLQLDDVVATAGVKAAGDTHTAVQDLTIGGASVSGQSVVIGNGGVTAIGAPVLPATTLEQASAQADAALAAAGISVHTVGGSTAHTSRSAEADTGGVQIEVGTPSLPGGVPGNRLSVVVGIDLTELDTLALPALLPPLDLPGVSGGSTSGQTTTTFQPGTPGVPGSAGLAPVSPPPVLAPAQPAAFVVQGRRISGQVALLAFAGWQFLSLGTATLYGFVERRRRMALLGRSA
jgi:hypothetical protein